VANAGSQPSEADHSDGAHEHGQPGGSSRQTVDEDHSHPDSEAVDNGDDHSSHSHGDNNTPVVVSESGATVNAFRAALSSGDKATVMTLLASDVLIFESGGAERSRDEYESHHLPADMAFLQEMSTTVTQQRDYQSADFALVVTESRTRGMYQNEEIDLAGTETMMLEKRDDEWKIVHIHWSSRPVK
jgi:ketosteroid isomerase-like protein